MTGEKLALLAVSVAAIAYELDSEDLAIISFESEARLIKGLGVKSTVYSIVEKFLASPARGLTNMEAALKLAAKQTDQAKRSRRAVILMSDGRFTAGSRPDYLVPRLPRLHVVQTGNPWSSNRFFRRMASLGNGRFLQVSHFQQLPRALYSLVHQIVR